MTYLGHAGWLIQTETVRILCDPWFNPEGAYFASWFPMPANDHLDWADYLSVDAFYISHAHADHFDPWFLSHVPRSIPVLSSRFRNPDLRDSLRDLGFRRIIELDPDQSWTLREARVQILRDEDYGLYRDSCLVLSDGKTRVVNQNDCRLSAEDAESIAHSGGADVLLVQFSGAIWHPCVYEYPREKKEQLGREKRQRGLHRALNYGRLTGARMVIPCAGPAAFLDEQLFQWNDLHREEANTFPMMDEAVRFLDQSGVATTLAMPGDVLRVESGRTTLVHRMLAPEAVYADPTAYLAEYASRKKPLMDAALHRVSDGSDASTSLRLQTRKVVNTSRAFARLIKGPILWQFTGSGGGEWVTDFGHDPDGSFQPYYGQPVGYRLTLEARFAAEILKRRYIDWEDFFLSMRFQAWREPDLFDDILFATLKNMDSRRLEIAELLYQEPEIGKGMFDLRVDGRKCRVQRFCPHLGSDLQKIGTVQDGLITCGRHGWAFRLSDGRCENIEGQSIRVDWQEAMTDKQ